MTMAGLCGDDFNESGLNVAGTLLKEKDKASDFFMTAHFKWSSAYRNVEVSVVGCLCHPENGDHFAVFLTGA
jgi:hypothetical protein